MVLEFSPKSTPTHDERQPARHDENPTSSLAPFPSMPILAYSMFGAAATHPRMSHRPDEHHPFGSQAVSTTPYEDIARPYSFAPQPWSWPSCLFEDEAPQASTNRYEASVCTESKCNQTDRSQ